MTALGVHYVPASGPVVGALHSRCRSFFFFEEGILTGYVSIVCWTRFASSCFFARGRFFFGRRILGSSGFFDSSIVVICWSRFGGGFGLVVSDGDVVLGDRDVISRVSIYIGAGCVCDFLGSSIGGCLRGVDWGLGDVRRVIDEVAYGVRLILFHGYSCPNVGSSATVSPRSPSSPIWAANFAIWC